MCPYHVPIILDYLPALGSIFVSAISALTNVSADDMDGMVSLWGEKSTVLAIRSLLVFVIYVLWHR